ncbi:MAG: hypothetical protein AABX80_01075 [Nanoarchaeota archaeon]
MKNKRNKHDVLVGESKDFNLEHLLVKGKFNVFINGSIKKSYEKLYNYSKSQSANIAVIEEKNVNSIKGTFYSTQGNPFCHSDLIKGQANFDYTSNRYTLLNTF